MVQQLQILIQKGTNNRILEEKRKNLLKALITVEK